MPKNPPRGSFEVGAEDPSEVPIEGQIEDRETVAESEPVEMIPDREARDRSREKELNEAAITRERLIENKNQISTVSSSSAAAYVQQYLPKRFQETSVLASAHQKVSRMIFDVLDTLGIFKIRGRENVPETGACVIVSNHTRFFDESKLFAMLNRPAHIVGADMHFDMSFFHRWFMNAIGAIEVRSTLRNLSEAEKEELLTRVPGGAKAYYQKVIDRDRDPKAAGMKESREFLRTTVASLVKGDPIIIFPEGLWLYEGGKMRKAYGGIELIINEYRRVTGKDLPIVPVGITKGSATAGKAMILGDGQRVHDVMKAVAGLLPEEERGYYKTQQ